MAALFRSLIAPLMNYVEQTPPGLKQLMIQTQLPVMKMLSRGATTAPAENAVPLKEQARELVLSGTFNRCS